MTKARHHRLPSGFLSIRAASCLLSLVAATGVPATPPDFAEVDAIFNQHCLDCHAAQDPEHGLVLETFESLMKGGETGPAIVPGKSVESLLIQMVEGSYQKAGKPRIMPPGKRKKLTTEEIGVIKAWIDSGANGPASAIVAKELVVPHIVPKAAPRIPINALAYSDRVKLVAAARYGQVELRLPADLSIIRTLPVPKGNVNAVLFSADGSMVFAAGGQPALAGEVRQWNAADGELIRVLVGHKDAIYALALSPGGETLATGSYDQKIKLWEVATGKEIRTLSGHNGCIYHLSFRADGKILASASADRTVKLWDVASGERRETFSQSPKEVYAVAFSPDGRRLFAGGADSRIRVWEISETAAETSNPLIETKFAHEGAILNLVFSSDGATLISAADDRTVKVWDALQMKQQVLLEKQNDWPPALAAGAGGKVFVGRLDGTIGTYDTTTGKRLASIDPFPGAPASLPAWLMLTKVADKHAGTFSLTRFSDALRSADASIMEPRRVYSEAASSPQPSPPKEEREKTAVLSRLTEPMRVKDVTVAQEPRNFGANE